MGIVRRRHWYCWLLDDIIKLKSIVARTVETHFIRLRDSLPCTNEMYLMARLPHYNNLNILLNGIRVPAACSRHRASSSGYRTMAFQIINSSIWFNMWINDICSTAAGMPTQTFWRHGNFIGATAQHEQWASSIGGLENRDMAEKKNSHSFISYLFSSMLRTDDNWIMW